MKPVFRPPATSWSPWWCCLFAAAGLVLIGIWWVAAGLDPHPAGFGTHRQLGFPPCSMRVLVGIRCPACGMTTAWSQAANGAWWEAWQANPGGALLAAASLPGIAWLLASAGGRKTRRTSGPIPWWTVLVGVWVLITLGSWAFSVLGR